MHNIYRKPEIQNRRLDFAHMPVPVAHMIEETALVFESREKPDLRRRQGNVNLENEKRSSYVFVRPIAHITVL